MRKSFLLWTLFPIVALAVGFVAWRHVEITQREWQEMVAIADRMQAELDSFEDRRPILYGEPVEGRASDEYARAVRLLAPRVDERLERYRRAGRLDSDSASATAELLAQCADALVAAANGAHCEEVGFDVDWSRGFAVRIPSLKDYRALATVMSLTARQHVEAGRPERAAELLLDGMQLGRDLYHAPVLITSLIGGSVLTHSSYETLVDERLIDELSTRALRILAEGMERLDTALATTSRTYQAEIVMFTRGITDPDTFAAYLGQPGVDVSYWSRARFGFSKARMSAAYVRDSEHWLALMRASDDAPWTDRELAVSAATDHVMKSGNPISSSTIPRLLAAERSRYDAIAQFRIARAEVEFRLTGTEPTVVDPYGGTIVIREHDGQCYARSRGADDPQSSLHRFESVLLTGGFRTR